ncbi:MAG: EAL domain-containing protein [Lachnospiraceae bacterium]|nr:EAL domain-containing protein [Lachnospiraceae bacterium]
MAETLKPATLREDPLEKVESLLGQVAFYEQVQHSLQSDAGNCHMLAVAIEDFSVISDLYGKEITTDILVRTAEILKNHCVEGDVLGRVKRDEFSLLIVNSRFSEQWVQDIFNKFQEASSPYHIFLHIGVYRITDTSASVVSICNRAFVALDHIADKDGNHFGYYSDTLTDHATLRRKVIREVEDALDKEHFQIFLQPQLDPEGKLIGAESLVRWNHPEDGILPPGKFVGILEEAGLIYLIDRYVWELAVSQLESWHDTPHADLQLSVNISKKDFYYLDIFTIFTDLVEQYSIKPSQLKLEIMEDALVVNANRRMIERLKDEGFVIEIDKFGGDMSSLNILKNFEADAVKLDTSFVRELNKPRSRIVLGAVIDICKQLQMRVIAEGVETEEQLSFLKEKGCDAFQGYYFDKPMTVSEFEQKYFT